MPPTPLEARDLAPIVDTNTLTRMSPAVGTIFVMPAWAVKSIGGFGLA